MNLLAKNLNQPVEVEPQSSEWPEKALDRLMSQFPDLVGTVSSVEMNDTNEGDQSGDGTITLRSDTAFVEVPFYVREGKLQPLDLMVYQEETMPLSEGRLRRLLLSQSDIGQVSSEGDSSAIYGETPVHYVNRESGPYDMQKMSSARLLERVTQSMAPDRLREKLARLEEPVWTALRAAPHAADKLIKVANQVDNPPVPLERPRAFHVEAVAPAQYKVAVIGPVDRGFPALLDEYDLGGSQAVAFMEETGWPRALDLVDQQGGVSFPTQKVSAPVSFAEDFTDDIDPQKLAAGPALVWDQQGGAHDGIVMHHHDWQGEPTGQSFFLAPSGYAIGEALAGQASKTAATLTDHMIGSMMLHNKGFAQKVAFCWQDQDGWHITQPMKLARQIRQGDTLKVSCVNDLGQRIDYEPSGLAAMANAAGTNKEASPTTPQTVWVPHDALPIAVDLPLMVPAEASLIKLGFAVRRQHNRGPALTIEGGEGQWRAHHPLMLKEATALNATTLPVFLACCGLDPGEQARVQEKLASSPQVRLWGADVGYALTPPPQEEKRAVHRDARKMAHLMELVQHHQPEWWTLATHVAKVAAELDEPEAADQMSDTGMSMALAEEDEADVVAEALPCIEESLQYCSQILLKARKGEIPIVPDIVRQAMQALDKLAENLTGLVESQPEMAEAE